MDIYISGKRTRVDPNDPMDQGGEAYIYKLPQNQILKLYKGPKDPEFKGMKVEQQAAKLKLQEYQHKLPSFPQNLPPQVIRPNKLATNKKGEIVGYTMDFVKNSEVLMKYGQKKFRHLEKISNNQIGHIFQNLYNTVSQIHSAGAIIGDFNDLNIMVQDDNIFIIDADSFQFGKFMCHTFTTKFADPMLCQLDSNKIPFLAKTYVNDSDWYAFNIMLMQSLLLVDPYGGIYRPKNKKNQIGISARPTNRITVFHPDVQYPKPALHYDNLPDELLQHFHNVFISDHRGQFPINILENLDWKICTDCGNYHARSVCPKCSKATPISVVSVTQIRGNVIATRIHSGSQILHACVETGKLRWIYYDDNSFLREDKSLITKGDVNHKMRFRICGEKSYIAQEGQLIEFQPDQEIKVSTVDTYGNLSMFDTNKETKSWIYNGQLHYDGPYGPEYIGNVLQNQTLFWLGSKFGFGIWRASNISNAFIFRNHKSSINDNINIPSIRGQLLDCICYFTDHAVWFLTSTKEKSQIINKCFLIDAKGNILASEEAVENDGSWLGSIRGKCVAGDFMLAATDNGIIKIKYQNSRLIQTEEFPDTEPFVDSATHLFVGKHALYSVRSKEIYELKLTK